MNAKGMGEFIYRYRGLPRGKEDFFWGVFTVGAFLCWWMMGFFGWDWGSIVA